MKQLITIAIILLAGVAYAGTRIANQHAEVILEVGNWTDVILDGMDEGFATMTRQGTLTDLQATVLKREMRRPENLAELRRIAVDALTKTYDERTLKIVGEYLSTAEAKAWIRNLPRFQREFENRGFDWGFKVGVKVAKKYGWE